MLWSGDPEVINQIAGQGTKFVKPVELFSFFDIFGPNMQTSKGKSWRSDRKIVAPAIGPHSNAAMWQAALHESKKLTEILVKDDPVVSHMKDHMSEISLHCITKSLFDTELEYETTNVFPSPELPAGRLGFVEAMFTTIDKIGIIDSIPKGLRAWLPSKVVKRADKAYWDLRGHMSDMCDQASKVDKRNPVTTDKNVMDALTAGTRPESSEQHGKVLSRDNLIGNVFFFLLGGHGTAGNTLGFLIFLLAVRQDIQTQLQAHLDTQLGDRPPAAWSVEADFPPLYTGYTGAVLKEAMRLYNVVEFIPRRCTADTPVTDLGGAQMVVPKDTLCLLNLTAAFRHPQIWPAKKKKDKVGCNDATGRYHPMLDFDPARWDGSRGGENIIKPSDVGSRTYFPFGLGPRGCLGKTLASVMMVGVLAAVFKEYSVELVAPPVVLEEAEARKKEGDEEAAGEEWIKKRTYEWALGMLVDEVECNLLVELRKELPVRLVPRKPR
ncbi:MAG: hypothetical protein LQ346_003822 [Caloplaca aetnensis]|nr:MAG: hypothetical protein LQ346_003822 [Caloplaca aetnensis]